MWEPENSFPLYESMLTQARLKEVLKYDQHTGVFVWKISTNSHIKIGQIAGHLDNDEGYIRIGIDRKLYRAHRLAWLYVHGVWPTFEIDHRDHDRKNNAINNLRDITKAGNQQNQINAPRTNLSTGLLGVSFKKRLGKYIAQITILGKKKHLGCFDVAEDAHKAYLDAKRIHHQTCTI